MKKLLLIFTLLFSTLMFSTPSYGEWTKVSKNVSGTTFYVDFERIRKHGGYVYYWTLGDYLKPSKGGDLSARAYYQVDCELFRYKILSDSYYIEPMGGGEPSATSNEPDKNWSYAPPHSSIEGTLKRVCSQ
jgi:hypothetical protein